MTHPIKYSLELLKNFCYEKQVKLGKNYDNEVLFGSTKIVYHCTKCNIENKKSFTFLITPFFISNADFMFILNKHKKYYLYNTNGMCYML